MLPLRIELKNKIPKGGSVNIKTFCFSKRDLSNLFRCFYFVISSGINLVKGINILKGFLRNRKYNNILNNIFQYIAIGNSLSESMKLTGCFPDFVIELIKIGENTGKLEEIFLELSSYYEEEYNFEAKLKEAIYYPIFLLSTSFVAFLIISKQVIPKFFVLFRELNIKELPQITKYAIYFNKIFYYFILGFAFMILAFFVLSIVRNKRIKMFYHRIMLSVPLYKDIKTNLEISRFTKCLALILESGGSIIEALESSKKLIGNLIMYEDVEGAINDIKLGKSISEAFNISRTFPLFFIELISVGEETGELEDSLKNISNFLNAEILKRLKSLVNIINPIIIIIISVHVGFLVLSIMLPMFELLNNFNL